MRLMVGMLSEIIKNNKAKKQVISGVNRTLESNKETTPGREPARSN